MNSLHISNILLDSEVVDPRNDNRRGTILTAHINPSKQHQIICHILDEETGIVWTQNLDFLVIESLPVDETE